MHFTVIKSENKLIF